MIGDLNWFVRVRQLVLKHFRSYGFRVITNDIKIDLVVNMVGDSSRKRILVDEIRGTLWVEPPLWTMPLGSHVRVWFWIMFDLDEDAKLLNERIIMPLFMSHIGSGRRFELVHRGQIDEILLTEFKNSKKFWSHGSRTISQWVIRPDCDNPLMNICHACMSFTYILFSVPCWFNIGSAHHA